MKEAARWSNTSTTSEKHCSGSGNLKLRLTENFLQKTPLQPSRRALTHPNIREFLLTVRTLIDLINIELSMKLV